MVTDHLAFTWLVSWKDPRERLARWVVEVQDFDFTVENRAGMELVVPDTLSGDAVPEPLCQRCYSHLSGEILEAHVLKEEQERVESAVDGIKVETVSAVAEVRSFAYGPTREEIRTEQEKEFRNLAQVAATDRRKRVDD